MGKESPGPPVSTYPDGSTPEWMGFRVKSCLCWTYSPVSIGASICPIGVDKTSAGKLVMCSCVARQTPSAANHPHHNMHSCHYKLQLLTF